MRSFWWTIPTVASSGRGASVQLTRAGLAGARVVLSSPIPIFLCREAFVPSTQRRASPWYGNIVSSLPAASPRSAWPSSAKASHDEAPSPRQIAFAQEVSDLMLNELVAALFQEFDETTPQNVEHGKQAISLIFNDLNRDMRLVGAFGPLLGGSNDRPDDRFERTALSRALAGEPYAAVQKVNDRWYTGGRCR